MCAAKSNRKLWTDFLTNKKRLHLKTSTHIKQNSIVRTKIITSFRGKILGIDPSLRGTGLAVIDIKNRDEIDLIFSQTVKIPTKEPILECTYRIFSAIKNTIECYQPAVCAMEQTIYVQNFQTAQIMGIARGAALAAISHHRLKIFEYAPLRIKQAICGYGRASKEQIAKMVQAILKIHIDVGFDETDATAVALCCCFTEYLT